MMRILCFLYKPALLFLSMTAALLKAQTIYTTSFNAGHGWTLNSFNNLNTGVEGDSPNPWYVSDKESNKAAGNRGGALCGNATLHIGSTTAGDLGAAYDAGGCTNLGFGPCASCVTNGLYCVKTDRSAVSPAISTLGQTGLTLSFLYIHWGTTLLDNADLIYSVNGGATWATLANVPKSGCCTGAASCALGCTANATCTGSHQGKWSLYSTMLPVSCENISNLMLGFRWYNDDVSTAGRDPSIGVDDVTITTSVLPEKSSLLEVSADHEQINLQWSSYSEASRGFDIERASGGMEFTALGHVKSHANAAMQYDYIYHDTTAARGQLYYYRYKETAVDGSLNYSNILFGEVADDLQLQVYPNPAGSTVTFSFAQEQGCTISICDVLGKVVCLYAATRPANAHTLDVTQLQDWIYFYKISGSGRPGAGKLFVRH